MRAVGFGDHAGELAVQVLASGQLTDVSVPRGDDLVFDARLGEVVEDEGLLGVTVDELDGSGQVTLEDQDVVPQLEIQQRVDAFVEIPAEDESRIGLVLEYVAHAGTVLPKVAMGVDHHWSFLPIQTGSFKVR